MRSFVFNYLSTTVAQLLFDFIKHTVAHVAHVAPFAPFPALFLLVLLLVSRYQNLLIFFHIRKVYGEVWKRNIKTLLETFAQGC